MAGAACGAILITRVMGGVESCFRMFKIIELAIIGFSVAFPLVLFAMPTDPGNAAVFVFLKILFLTTSFIGGLLTGAQFPLANRLYSSRRGSLSETAGLLYASDLLGGWFGGIVGAVVLLPVLGLTGTCISVGLLKLMSFTVIATQHDHQLLWGEK